MVYRLQPSGLDRRRHPQTMNRTETAQFASQPGQLGRRRQTVCHQLHFVHHPEAIVVQKPVLHRPHERRASITPVEGTRQQHILGADNDLRAFGVKMPLFTRLAPHEHDDIDVVRPLQLRKPISDPRLGLFDQRSHRKTVDQPARRGRPHARVGMMKISVKPAQDGGLRLPGTRRNLQQSRKILPLGKFRLIGIRLVAGRVREKIRKIHSLLSAY